MSSVVVAVPVSKDGTVDPRWGRAERIALATVQDGTLSGWDEHAVGWGELHDTGSERAHHARVARFVKQQKVQAVSASHMGPEMLAMLERMGVIVRLGARGDARQAALAAARAVTATGTGPAVGGGTRPAVS